jgi:outer membrane biosynthesis protein TonB
MVGNYFKQGPSDASTFPFNFLSNGQYYTRDNFISEVGVIQDPWAEAHKHYGLRYHAKRGQRVSQLFDFPAITTHDAQTAYQLVLRESGCLPHDAVTRRTMREVQEGAGFWGEGRGEKLMDGMEPVEPPTDTDRDGMPDAWETHQGLDPQRKDHRRVMPSGYTAIEEYINQLADAMIVAQREGRPTVEGQRSVWQPTGAPRPPLPPASPDELGDPELPKPAEPAKPASKPKSPPKPATKPAPAKPAEAPKPKPAEAPKSKPAEPAKPVESAKPAPPPAADKPAEAADQPAAPPRPAELPPPQGQVSAIVLPAGADDATLARQINGQTQLDALHIVQAAVTDEGMVPVRALTTLRILSLEGTPVTDLTLEIIASLPNLQALNLGGTLVTPKGLLHLRGMKSLRVLDVPADFTDPMLAQLRQAMPNVTIERGQ